MAASKTILICDDDQGMRDTIGAILMIVGAVGVVLSMIFWSSWGGFGNREVAVDGGPRRRRVIEDDV